MPIIWANLIPRQRMKQFGAAQGYHDWIFMVPRPLPRYLYRAGAFHGASLHDAFGGPFLPVILLNQHE